MSIIRNQFLLLFIAVLASMVNTGFPQVSALVHLGTAGKLEYVPYANWGQTNAVNIIPDFSFCGYKAGGVTLPYLPVRETLHPGTGDARVRIQAAIDRVSAQPLDADGFRGAVVLKSGRYEINGSLFIKAGGVVLRGEGQNTPERGGTELVATSRAQHDFIQVTGTVTSSSGAAKRITTAYVPTGAYTFSVANVTGLSVGDTINVTRTPNDLWINTLDMAQYGWTASSYEISYERIITSITGNVVTVNIPIVQAIDTLYGGGEISRLSVSGRIRYAGIENMMISSFYLNDTDEQHGWSAVTLSNTVHSWVRKVTARYFGYACVLLSQAYHSSIEECAMLDPKSITTGSRKYPFNIDKGSFNLFQRCYARGGRHDFVLGSRVAGPNAFVDCFSEQTYADIGPHHRYSTGTLFDNIRGGEIRVQNRKDMGSGHGWAGAQTLFWNCVSDAGEFKVETPIGAMNWGIGCKGIVKNGAGFWESWGTPVTPRSLYFQQLKDRLGEQAVTNVTVPQQLTGSIWTPLKTWAGIGDFANPLNVCTESRNDPDGFILAQNYPNPFNPETIISYSVPFASFVTMKVYNILGMEIATLVNEYLPYGTHFVTFNVRGAAVPSGTYYYELRAGEYHSFRKMVLLK